MPLEPLPRDRKDFFKEREHDRSSESLAPVSRRRETPHHASSPRDFARWGLAEFRNRHQGHGKQGGWHVFSEESGHGFTQSWTNEKILHEESCWPSGSCRDGKYRSSRENRVSVSHKDWRGHRWGTIASPKGPGGSHVGSEQMSFDDEQMYSSHVHSDFEKMFEQLQPNDQHDKTDVVNGLGMGQKLDGENSLSLIDWRPLKWTRSGSLSSRSSSFSHSSSSKSIGVDYNEAKTAVLVMDVTPVESPAEDAAVCVTSAAPTEEMISRKKPRLGWGEGLAKYEKKKVEGLDDSATKSGTIGCGDTEPIHFQSLSLVDKSPRVNGFSDCGSPATPSSVGCSSTPGMDDKSFAKVADNDNDNLFGSPSLVARGRIDGLAFTLENMELTPVANLSSLLDELLQSDDSNLMDSSFGRSTAVNKLLVWKGDILKALEITESELDLLETEMKSLVSDSGNTYPCLVSSSLLPVECHAKPCEEPIVTSISIPRLTPLHVASSGDIIVDNAVGAEKEKAAEIEYEDVDSPATVSFKIDKPLSSVKACLLHDTVKHHECSGSLEGTKCENLEIDCPVNGSNEEHIVAIASGDGTHLMTSDNCACPPDQSEKDILYNLILASNKDTANRASAVFNKLLPMDQCYNDFLRAPTASCWQNNLSLKERFSMRKRFLRFKERVVTFKFRAFQHLWKEDMRLLSIRKLRAKSQKRCELSSRTAHSGYQKHLSYSRARFSSPAGNLGVVPTSEIINCASNLISDSRIKLYRNTLKMPAFILDRKEKMVSRFISSNGLVEDPCAVEKERALINPWTLEEKEVFIDKLASFGKDFRKIASFLGHKTTADCIEFYYKNHKSDCFEKTKRKPAFANRGKLYSTKDYLVMSRKRWDHEMNATSLDVLGEASAIAASADDGMENQPKGTTRGVFPSDRRSGRRDGGILGRSTSLDVSGNAKETVAADVLAGICGSFSSEAVGSCITSSFDIGEGYWEWKCRKMGFSMGQPFIAEVTQNVDDETCSDESYGEMDSTDWTDEEKSTFIQALSSYGKDFALISQCIRTRSRDQCKVFFSKARKCLGLDMVHNRACNEGTTMTDGANGGGSDAKDACIVETSSVICIDKSVHELDGPMLLSDLNMKCDSSAAATLNLGTKLNVSEENNGRGQQDYTDPVNIVTNDCQSKGKPEIDFNGKRNMENGVDDKHLLVQVQENSVLAYCTEAGRDEATGKGDSVEESVPVDVGNEDSMSTGQVSTDIITESGGRQLFPENVVRAKQDNNSNDNSSLLNGLNGTHEDSVVGNTYNLSAVTNSFLGVTINPEHRQEIALKLESEGNPHTMSLLQDSCLVTANSLAKTSTSVQYEKTCDQDLSSILDFERQCENSGKADDCHQPVSGHSLLKDVESSQILQGYLLEVSAKKEMNGEISSKKPASFQRLSMLDGNFRSDLCLLQDSCLRKCNSSKGHSLVAGHPSMSLEQLRDQSRSHPQSSSDVEKPCRNGDLKLFGKILSYPLSQQKLNSSAHGNEHKGSLYPPQLSSRSSDQKFSHGHCMDMNPAKLERNNYLGDENLQMRNYSFWDGNIVQTGFSSLPDPAILLERYPAAFCNDQTSSKVEQQPLASVVRSDENNLSGFSIFSTRDVSSNGVADYQASRNQDGMKVQPFTVEVQRPSILFSEMQRRNGFEAVSNVQQKARGMVGIVGRGGIVVGSACTGISDPVAAIKMHYAKAEQCNGQAGGIIRDDDTRRGR